MENEIQLRLMEKAGQLYENRFVMPGVIVENYWTPKHITKAKITNAGYSRASVTRESGHKADVLEEETWIPKTFLFMSTQAATSS